MGMLTSPKVKNKLAKKQPPVSVEEVEQCLADRDRSFLIDQREQNLTIPPTQWFIASTDMGRQLKIVFVELENGDIAIKTAYGPNSTKRYIYYRHSQPL